ncbi:hypothetical protein PC112_g8518 [Phytophthora cactorum]|nr:hypothetical protein PC112_g8518 [Phytophthora cactorum]
MMKESWSPQELELQTCCGSIVEHARLYSLEATKPAQLGDGNNVGVHLPQYGRQGLTASTSFTTQWRNNNDVEAFEEKLGVGEILEDRAAVAEQLGFDPKRVATASSLMAAVVSTVISAPRLLLCFFTWYLKISALSISGPGSRRRCATHKDVGGDANVNANLGSNGVLANFQLAAGQLEVHASGECQRALQHLEKDVINEGNS